MRKGVRRRETQLNKRASNIKPQPQAGFTGGERENLSGHMKLINSSGYQLCPMRMRVGGDYYYAPCGVYRCDYYLILMCKFYSRKYIYTPFCFWGVFFCIQHLAALSGGSSTRGEQGKCFQCSGI